MSTIIELGNKKRMGKDTIARILSHLYISEGKAALVLSFADRLKSQSSRALGVDRDTLENWKNEEPFRLKFIRKLSALLGFTPILPNRDGVISIATLAREVDDKFYVKSVREIIDKGEFDVYIIPDMRFPTEVFKDAVTVNIRRSGIPMSDTPSETMLDDFNYDLIYNNNHSLKDTLIEVKKLKQEIDKIAKRK
jgi:hypothetical protein